MTGTVLVVFGSNGSGRILGEDNQYYDFNKSDYSGVLKKGFQVQFEPHNSFAKRIAILPQIKSRTEASLSPNEHFSSSTADSNNFVQRLPGSGDWLWNYIGAYTLQILFVTQTIPSGWRAPIFVDLIQILLFYYCYRCVKFTWDQLRRHGGSISTKGIIARILIPIYNIYGIPDLFYRWSKEFNSINRRSNLMIPSMPIGFSIWTGLTTVLFLLVWNEASLKLITSKYNNESDFEEFVAASILLLGFAHILSLAIYVHMSLRRSILLSRIIE